MQNVAANGFSNYHQLIEAPDYLVLPDLVEHKFTCNMAYIDGWHTFDYVLLDFFYIDRLLLVGGVVGFNDCGLRAVNRVLHFVVSHRKFVEIDVGLRKTYVGRNWTYRMMRRLLNIPTNDRWYRKMANWEPTWNYYANF